MTEELLMAITLIIFMLIAISLFILRQIGIINPLACLHMVYNDPSSCHCENYNFTCWSHLKLTEYDRRCGIDPITCCSKWVC